MNFVLASSSKSRLDLLKKMGFNPKFTFSPDIDETCIKNELVRNYVKRMSETKALFASLSYPEEMILAADTAVNIGTIVLGKALTDEDVYNTLIRLSGRRHRVYTSVTLLLPGKNLKTKIVLTIVKFKRLTKLEIDGYVNSKEGIGKAGGYSIQGKANLFLHYVGGSITNVIGLPIYETASLLQSIKIYPKWDFSDGVIC